MPQPLRQPPHRQVWLLVLAVIVVVGAALAWQLWLRPAGPVATTAAGPVATTAPSPTDATRPPTTLKPEPGVLWQRTGSDIELGGAFDAPKKWRIVWSFNCRNFAKFGGGNFKLTGDGDFEQVLVQQFAVKANGTERVTGGGRGRLVIDSVCERWTVKAIAP
jgi:hypothetical protein